MSRIGHRIDGPGMRLGLIFLFVVIVLFGILGLFYINRLSNEGRQVLKLATLGGIANDRTSSAACN